MNEDADPKEHGMCASRHPADDNSRVAESIQPSEEAANAWMRGDVDRYLELVHHARGFTLIAPAGGPPVQYADRRREFAGWQSPFARGEAALMRG